MNAEAAVRQFYEALNTGNTDLLDDILADDWINDPLPPGFKTGRENYKAVIAWLREVFPDLHITIEDIVVSEDATTVALRLTGRGTHSGELFGIPATGQQVQFAASDFHRLEGERIVASWHVEDFLGVTQQLEAQITPAQPQS